MFTTKSAGLKNYDYYKYLFDEYVSGTETSEERQELFDFLITDSNNPSWQILVHEFLSKESTDNNYNYAKWEQVVERILNNKKKQSVAKKIVFARWAAAMICISLLSLIAYSLLKNNADNSAIVKSNSTDNHAGNRGAILTLGDGRKVLLDTFQNNMIIAGQSTINVSDGIARYETRSSHAVVEYNTIATPLGKEYKILLPDGTLVRLNAGSSIRFPTEFKDKKRKVIVSGELYFEVFENKAQPFVASIDGMEVTALGTKFSVNAYDGSVKTTLVEGSVAVTNNNQEVILNPGEQAVWEGPSPIIVRKVDLAEQMDWVNGYFVFRDADIQSIMDKAARWYQLDVTYKKKPLQLFVADIPRYVTANEFFKMLEATGWVHFTVSGNNVVVE